VEVQASLDPPTVIELELNVTTASKSVGGTFKESIESIRANAPFQYAAQNRMVTTADYSSLILRNYSQYISDIQTWGGEDDVRPDFGAVLTSIVFTDGLDQDVIDDIKDGIQDLVSQLAIASFRLKFVEPVITYIEARTEYQFNPRLTTLSQRAVSDLVDQAVTNYFLNNVGKFTQSFGRSNMLTRVDAVSPAVLSSAAAIKMQQRIDPRFTLAQSWNLQYPVPIAQPLPNVITAVSTLFVVNINGSSKTVRIQNADGSNILQLVDTSGIVVNDGIGEIVPDTGVVRIDSLVVQSVIGGARYIKISVIPANQATIAPLRNEILKFDENLSFSTAVRVATQYQES
jgi:hypothetical protein